MQKDVTPKIQISAIYSFTPSLDAFEGHQTLQSHVIGVLRGGENHRQRSLNAECLVD